MAGFLCGHSFATPHLDLGITLHMCMPMYTSNKNIHFEMILDVGIGEKRKETRFLI